MGMGKSFALYGEGNSLELERLETVAQQVLSGILMVKFFVKDIKGVRMIRTYLKDGCFLKDIEEPALYDSKTDDIYLLSRESFDRIRAMSDGESRDDEAAALLEKEGLVQTEARRTAAWVGGSSPLPSLRYLELQITGRCDKRCRHCYLGPAAPVDMSAGEIGNILHEFEFMQGLKVMVSGGEPLCSPRFEEVLEVLEGRLLRTVLLTHGEKINSAMAENLAMFDQVQISLDGMEGGHDRLRGEGSFRRVVAGIEALQGEGVPVAVATMVHRGNMNDFKRLSRFIIDMGITEWNIDIPCRSGRWAGGEEKDGTFLRAMAERLRFGFGGGYHGGADGLACGAHLMTVFPDGVAAKCGFYRERAVGYVREGLAGAWMKIDHLPLSGLQCGCDQLEDCGGGCRFRAEVMTGEPLGPDVVQCLARGVDWKKW
ncbi:MAG TPA: radical SAM protein [Proteobacteria bacterium]|nr:antilisterial bacteriocin subtilosin biosynthesis protein AlbA [bacterium BMS3Abin14]HDL53506.1 radical SAM protein [Pseudomonadota bacterium]